MAGLDRLKVFSGILVVFLVLGSCASNDGFLVQNLSDQAKAKALVESGIEQYNLFLVAREDFSQIPRIREIFQVALDFDAASTGAQRYLTQINSLQKSKLNENLAEAQRLQRKSSRREDEDFALALAVRKAVALAPSDPAVRKLAQETSGARDALIRNNLAKITKAMEAAEKSTGAGNAEAAYVDAFLAVVKLSGIQPDDSRIKDYSSRLKSKIAVIIEKKLADIPGLVKQASFTRAKSQLDLVLELDRKLEGNFKAQTSTVAHELYLAWATYNFERKDWEAAETRVDQALSFKKSSTATALKRRIADRPPEAIPFETVLGAIDKDLAASRLVEARKAIAEASANPVYAAQSTVLENRSTQIRTLLKDLYARGLAAYREEKFAQAIELLAPVHAFDSSYEQVADFLQKARDKQKVLNQY